MQRPVPVWALIVGSVVSLLAGLGLASLLRSHAPTDAAPKDASAELAVASAHLNAGELQDAYDALLAAMRVAPTDEKVFDASLDFVRKAGKDGDDEAIPLAQDVHQRAANLIPFLPLARLKDARVAHTQAGDEVFASKRAANPEDPLAEAENLLTAARRASLPNFARARLLHEVEAELGSQARRVASTTMKPKDEENFWNRWKGVKDSYEDAQKDVLTALYQQECRPRIQAWAKKVDEFNKQRASASLDEIHRANEELLALVVEGQRISRDLTPYLEGGVDAAGKDNQEVGPDRHLNRLAQLREWNYNRWALNRAEKVEQSGGSALDKLRSLSVIDETRLAPYVGQRFTEVWKKFFEECSKDDKVEATKARILREYQE
jgi:hypothetical protein